MFYLRVNYNDGEMFFFQNAMLIVVMGDDSTMSPFKKSSLMNQPGLHGMLDFLEHCSHAL